MANNPPEGYSDDFLEQIFAIPTYNGLAGTDGSSSETIPLTASHLASGGGGGIQQPFFPLGLSLYNGHRERGSMNMGSLFPGFEHLQPHSVRHTVPQIHQAFQGQTTTSTAMTVPHPPNMRPRVRARRGHATDPHSIAERLRRERIAERMRALQEFVPGYNKSDKAAMLDEILDYVKFLRLQVKVLSTSRLGGAGAVAQVVADIPLQSVEGGISENGNDQPIWENWSNDDTEQEVAKLMDENVGAAMQFLQSKALCIMPISLAALIYPTNQPDISTLAKPEPPAPS